MPCVATNISGLSEIYLLLVISTMKKTGYWQTKC